MSAVAKRTGPLLNRLNTRPVRVWGKAREEMEVEYALAVMWRPDEGADEFRKEGSFEAKRESEGISRQPQVKKEDNLSRCSISYYWRWETSLAPTPATTSTRWELALLLLLFERVYASVRLPQFWGISKSLTLPKASWICKFVTCRAFVSLYKYCPWVASSVLSDPTGLLSLSAKLDDDSACQIERSINYKAFVWLYIYCPWAASSAVWSYRFIYQSAKLDDDSGVCQIQRSRNSIHTLLTELFVSQSTSS